MMFFASQKKVTEAIDRNDVAFLRAYLKRHPRLLEKQYSWPSYSGYILNYAAAADRPDVVALLITDFGANPNRQEGVANKWTALHHAAKMNAYRAGAKLLALGADPKLANGDGTTNRDFAASDGVQELMDPAFVEKKLQRAHEKLEKQQRDAAARKAAEETERQRRTQGGWTLTGPHEVTHSRETPDGSQRLTDVFNFETRIWRAVVSDVKGQGVAQNIFFFDSLPDTHILKNAITQLRALGGTADDAAIPATGLDKKILKAGPANG